MVYELVWRERKGKAEIRVNMRENKMKSYIASYFEEKKMWAEALHTS